MTKVGNFCTQMVDFCRHGYTCFPAWENRVYVYAHKTWPHCGFWSFIAFCQTYFINENLATSRVHNGELNATSIAYTEGEISKIICGVYCVHISPIFSCWVTYSECLHIEPFTTIQCISLLFTLNVVLEGINMILTQYVCITVP